MSNYPTVWNLEDLTEEGWRVDYMCDSTTDYGDEEWFVWDSNEQLLGVGKTKEEAIKDARMTQ